MASMRCIISSRVFKKGLFYVSPVEQLLPLVCYVLKPLLFLDNLFACQNVRGPRQMLVNWVARNTNKYDASKTWQTQGSTRQG